MERAYNQIVCETAESDTTMKVGGGGSGSDGQYALGCSPPVYEYTYGFIGSYCMYNGTSIPVSS